ncbi:MAG: hypothetical protein OHK0012_16600 [Synechococcales cyanobacterium]
MGTVYSPATFRGVVVWATDDRWGQTNVEAAMPAAIAPERTKNVRRVH